MIIIKKILIIIAITITFIAYDSTNNKDNIVIPDTAIRLRVIPNSNTIEDQTQKQVIKNTIENYIANNLTDLNNINDARNTIKNNLDNLKKEIDKTIKKKIIILIIPLNMDKIIFLRNNIKVLHIMKATMNL